MGADDAYWRQPAAGELDAGGPTDRPDRAGAEVTPGGESAAPRPAPPTPHEVATWSAPAQGRPVEPPAPVHPATAYRPPPPTTAPPIGWRPPLVVEPPPPRRLPGQDHGAIDHDEARARSMTWSLGAVLGVVLLVFLCVLCGQINLNF